MFLSRAMLMSVITVPPASVDITADPPVARAGQLLKLTCVSASSNPAAVLTWIHDNLPVSEVCIDIMLS